MNFEDLKEFCDPDRIKMGRAWVIDGYAYATNGHIGIKLKVDLPDNHNFNYVNLNSLIESHKSNCNYQIDFSQEITFKTKPLYKIEKNEVRCESCDGDGEIECPECGSVVDCKECNGKGILSETIYSKDIDRMIIDESILVKIRDTYFNPRYIHLIQKYFPQKARLTHLAPLDSAKFEFDNATIILMPIRVKEMCESIEIKLEELNEL